MGGTDPGFDAAEFRNAIHFAMTMGTPAKLSERLQFRWSTDASYTIADPAGETYDWTVAPATPAPVVADLWVMAAWEFVARPAGSRDTTIGQFDETRIVVTVLDEEYVQLIAHGGTLPDRILAHTNVYRFDFEAPPIGLFEATIHTFYASALDES